MQQTNNQTIIEALQKLSGHILHGNDTTTGLPLIEAGTLGPALHDLFCEAGGELNELVKDYVGFLQEVSCLLINDEVKMKFKDSCYAVHAGEFMIRLLQFFRWLEGDKSFEVFLRYMQAMERLSSYSITTEEPDNSIQQRTKELAAEFGVKEAA